MAEPEAIQSVVTQVAIQTAITVVMAMREADTGPICLYCNTHFPIVQIIKCAFWMMNFGLYSNWVSFVVLCLKDSDVIVGCNPEAPSVCYLRFIM